MAGKMAKSRLPEIVSTIFSDIAALEGIPGTATVGTLVSEYRQRRAKDAQEILLEELRSGDAPEYEVGSQDDQIGFIFRYLRFAQEGTARVNLRLLAKAIVGQIRRTSLVADEFLQYVDMLASLSRDEIIFIATMYKFWLDAEEQRKIRPVVEPKDPWTAAKEALCPDVFPNKEYVEGVAARAQRSGLVAFVGVYGGPAYKLTPLMFEVAKLVDFQDALQREGIEPV